MNHISHSPLAAYSSDMAPSRMEAGLKLLQEALLAAQVLGQDRWQFALEIEQLRRVGLTNTDLRWLLCKDYVLHAVEQVQLTGRQREFQNLSHLGLPSRSCFVLTSKGFQVAVHQLDEATASKRSVQRLGNANSRLGQECPSWDASLRQLCWQGQLIKHFRVPAKTQAAILSALEEEGWPPRIDDPLPQSSRIDPTARLQEAIKALNRNQVNRLLCFRGDGTGLGVIWCARGCL